MPDGECGNCSVRPLSVALFVLLADAHAPSSARRAPSSPSSPSSTRPFRRNRLRSSWAFAACATTRASSPVSLSAFRARGSRRSACPRCASWPRPSPVVRTDEVRARAHSTTSLAAATRPTSPSSSRGSRRNARSRGTRTARCSRRPSRLRRAERARAGRGARCRPRGARLRRARAQAWGRRSPGRSEEGKGSHFLSRLELVVYRSLHRKVDSHTRTKAKSTRGGTQCGITTPRATARA